MKAIIAVNHEGLQNFIKKIEDIEILRILVSKKNLIKECEENNPDVVIVSNNLSGDEILQEILIKISNLKQFTGRIIYLYGEDNPQRKKIIASLILNGIYDYYIGDLDQEVIMKLLFNPKTRNDVKDDIVDGASYEISNNDYVENSTKDEIKEKIIFIDRVEEVAIVDRQIIKERPNDYKKVVGFIGEPNVGRTFVLLQLASYLSNSIKVSVIDMTDNQGLYYYYDNDEEVTIINKNLTIYSMKHKGQSYEEIDKIKQKSDLVIIDFDLSIYSKDLNSSNQLNDKLPVFLDSLYIVNDCDPTHTRLTSKYVKALTDNSITDSKIKVIFNKVIVKSQVKVLFDLYRYGNEEKKLPAIKFFSLKMIIDEKLNEEVINFSSQVYKKDSEFNRQIEIIAKDIFSINDVSKKSFLKRLLNK